MSSTDSTQAYLTTRGVSSPLKDALLARFPHVRAAFNQTAFIESLNLPHQVLADIWLPVGFPPVSFEALGEEEQKVALSGQFSNTNVRSRTNTNYSTGEYQHRGSRTNNNNLNNPRQNRARGGSFVTAASSRTNETQPRNYRQQAFEKEDDDFIEDPDNLWATPSSDTFGSSDFGTFDENGMFRTGGAAAGGNLNSMGALEDFAASSAAFEGFMQTRPQHHTTTLSAPSNPPAVIPAVAPQSPPVAIPHITPDTQWLYRDPSGQIQGPFPSHRMMEWYNGKYFPENLPLRREQDHFFEPLSTWKTKCAGQIPFVAYTTPTPAPAPAKTPEPVNLGFGARTTSNTTSVPVSEWFRSEEKRNEAKIIEQLETTTTTKSAIPTTTTAASSATRSVPIESLFSLPATTSKSPQPEVTMPSWKKLEKPSITTKFGQLDINEPPQQQHQQPQLVIETSKSTSKQPTETTSDVPLVNNLATSTSTSSSSSWSNGSLKKISLSEILNSTPSEEPVISKTQQPQSTTAATAGWAKLSASPVQSLSSIQAEEAARQRANSASSSSASSASKSFADLVRSAGVITSGNIVVSPSISDRTPLEATSIRSTSTFTTSTSTNANTLPVKAKTSVESPSTLTSTSAKPSNSTSTTSIEDWCLTSLRKSPSLSKSIDPQTCTSLLLDLPNPPALLSFALETLKPLETGASFDLAAFIQELSIRKFGQKATEKVQWSKLKAVPQQAKQEESFEVVKRKK